MSRIWEGDRLEHVIASIVIVAIAVVVRFAVGRLVRRQTWASAEVGRRWMIQVRNITVLVAFIALVIVWAQELRTAALSLVAFAVAAVIATKEMIMAVGGSFSRATSGSFAVGDRVRIGAHRGDVIDHSLLTTTLLEIGPGHVRTGRTLVIPNNLLLTDAVANETAGHGYVLHSFAVPVAKSEWHGAQKALLAAAKEHSAEYVEDARREMERRARAHSLSTPIVDPFVLAKPTGTDTVELTVRVPVPAREAWWVENEILAAWLGRSDVDGAAAGAE
ncbi:MAG: mechanosensitive ion channel [Acidimicrobiia bacterium]|nr:mechanosensitive ion channel [Acidimicrobiia bacterium]